MVSSREEGCTGRHTTQRCEVEIAKPLRRPCCQAEHRTGGGPSGAGVYATLGRGDHDRGRQSGVALPPATLASATLASATLASATLASATLAGLALASATLASATLAGLALAGLTLAGLALAGTGATPPGHLADKHVCQRRWALRAIARQRRPERAERQARAAQRSLQ
jgi:hypothetical protein